MRGDGAVRAMPQLRRRVGAPPRAPRRQACEVSGFAPAQGESRRLRSESRRLTLFAAARLVDGGKRLGEAVERIGVDDLGTGGGQARGRGDLSGLKRGNDLGILLCAPAEA